MDRRKYLRTLAAGSLAIGAAASGILPGCKSEEDHSHHHHTSSDEVVLSEEDKALMKQKFFTDHEMQTVTVLADIIIPKDEHSGSASEAGVPEFIEFMMKDQPDNQIPMRGGLRWLDIQCMKRHDVSFVDCTQEQQFALLDEIAYPEVAKPEMSQGVNFFSLFRNFVATGFFTSKMGIADIGFMGNKPTVWTGAPEEVLKKLDVSY